MPALVIVLAFFGVNIALSAFGFIILYMPVRGRISCESCFVQYESRNSGFDSRTPVDELCFGVGLDRSAYCNHDTHQTDFLFLYYFQL